MMVFTLLYPLYVIIILCLPVGFMQARAALTNVRDAGLALRVDRFL